MENEIGTVGRTMQGGASSRLLNRVIADRYEVLEALGEGPLLSAFRARDRALNRIVVVKALNGGLPNSAAIADRIRSGLASVLSLNHAGIARVYDVGQDEAAGGLYLSEEYVRGIDLKERIRRVAPFSINAAVEVAIAVTEALEYVHARGVVHGDVRPANVLIGPEGHIKLSGFGAASGLTLLPSSATRSRVESYRAPEIIRADATQGDDLYALGVTLFEMLTGDLPFSGPRGADDPAPSPRSLNAGVPRALEGIVVKALSPARGDRYASAAEMLQDLRAVSDALRYGKSLSWSPLDRPSRSLPESAMAAVAGGGANDRVNLEETIVMPTGRGAKPAAQRASRARQNDDPPRGDGRWLSTLNLFMLALVLAGAAALAWMTMSFVRPPNDVVVPNLVGKSLSDAQSLATERKFTLTQIDEQYMDKYPEGSIYRMQPEPGRHIREGKPVNIWVSKGPRLVEVPDVRDMAIERATRMIQNRGFKLGRRESEYDPLAAKGNVLRQSPDPGENRPRGTVVDLVLSKGPEPPPPPIVFPEPPVDPSYTDPGVGSDNGSDTGDPAFNNRTRVFTVRYRVPNDNAPHRIRIDVTDKDGTRTVYDEMREPGERVQEDIEGLGRRVTIKLYDNDELRSEQTK